MREQPPSDSEAHLAFAFSQKLPGPPSDFRPDENSIPPTNTPVGRPRFCGSPVSPYPEYCN
jgi:hypothetical protein